MYIYKCKYFPTVSAVTMGLSEALYWINWILRLYLLANAVTTDFSLVHQSCKSYLGYWSIWHLASIIWQYVKRYTQILLLWSVSCSNKKVLCRQEKIHWLKFLVTFSESYFRETRLYHSYCTELHNWNGPVVTVK